MRSRTLRIRCAEFPALFPLRTTAMKKPSLRSTSNFLSPKSMRLSTVAPSSLNESRTKLCRAMSMPPNISSSMPGFSLLVWCARSVPSWYMTKTSSTMGRVRTR